MDLRMLFSPFEIAKDLYGIKDIDSLGRTEGTLWWTFYALPVVPIATYHIQLSHPEHDALKYEVLEKKRLDYHAVVKTYLNTALVLILAFFPLSLLVPSVQRWLGIPQQAFAWMLIGAMLWLIAVVVAAAKIHVRSGTPHMLQKPHDPSEPGIAKRAFLIIWIFLMAVLAGVFMITNSGPFPLLVKLQLLLGFFSFELTFVLLMAIEALSSLAIYTGYKWLEAKIHGDR